MNVAKLHAYMVSINAVMADISRVDFIIIKHSLIVTYLCLNRLQ